MRDFEEIQAKIAEAEGRADVHRSGTLHLLNLFTAMVLKIEEQGIVLTREDKELAKEYVTMFETDPDTGSTTIRII